MGTIVCYIGIVVEKGPREQALVEVRCPMSYPHDTYSIERERSSSHKRSQLLPVFSLYPAFNSLMTITAPDVISFIARASVCVVVLMNKIPVNGL